MKSNSRLTAFALGSSALFIALLLALHVVRADLEPSWHMVSEYSVGPWGWLMRLAFLALAGAFFSLMLALRSLLKGFVGVAGLVCLMVATVGLLMGGLFNTDPPGTAPEHISTTGALHGFAFMLGVPGVLLSTTLVTIALWRSASWRPQRSLLVATCALVWLTMLVFGKAMAAAIASHATGPGFTVGWQNRALVLAWALWVAIIASRARSLTRHEPSSAL